MNVEVRVPELGDSGAAEATISFWYVEEGEAVSEGDDLVEILTDKAAFTVPAPASGKLRAQGAKEGEVVKADGIVGYIETKE